MFQNAVALHGGPNNYKPGSSAVLAYLREVSGQTPSTWDVSKSKNEGKPASGATQGWDLDSNKGASAAVSHTHAAAEPRR